MFNFKTVDGILRNFTKAISDLEAVAEREQKNVDFFTEQAALNVSYANEAIAEEQRAIKAANKIKEFLGE